MNWQIDNSALPAYLKITITGKASVDDYLKMWQEVLSLNEWKYGTAILKDVMGRESLGAQAHPIQAAVADFLLEHEDEMGGSIIALLTGSDAYNYGRMLEYALRLRGSGMAVRSFDNEEGAVEWLTYMQD